MTDTTAGDRAATTSHEPAPTLAERVGSPDGMAKLKWGSVAVAFAILLAVGGYLVGERSSRPPKNAVDIGFLSDMSDHHDQAVELSLTALDRVTDPITQSFVREVSIFQRFELGLMTAYQEEIGVEQPDSSPDRTTMAWMGMSTPLRSMPGMATPEQIKALGQATGIDADLQFLTLMQAHHEGGAHMSEDAARNAANPRVRDLAQRMATNQRTEVREYQAQINKLRPAPK